MTDAYSDYWKPEEGEPSAPAPVAYDDYWAPEATPGPVAYDDYWTLEDKEPNAPVTDNYDSYWKESDPTAAAPEADGKAGAEDTDYWDATCKLVLKMVAGGGGGGAV